MVRKYVPSPEIPTLPANQSPTELTRIWAMDRTNFAAALALFQQERGSDKVRAMNFAERVAQEPNAPRYFNLLAAETAADLQDWPKAWQAIARFANIAPESSR
jgi:hypothetical protein